MAKKTGTERFAKACFRWQKLLGLEDYSITVRGLPGAPFKEREDAENHGEASAMSIFGSTETDPHYKSAVIEVRKEALERVSADVIDERACHEMIHVLEAAYANVSWEMLHEMPAAKREVYRKWRRQEGEELTSKLAGILVLMRKARKGKKEA